MSRICDLYDGWEYYITRAENDYQNGKYRTALTQGQMAQKYADTKARQTAIGIFIAKCYTAMGDYEQSSRTYRTLIKDGTYLPPVLMGLMYNNLEKQNTMKVQNNLTIVKLFTTQDKCESDQDNYGDF